MLVIFVFKFHIDKVLGEEVTMATLNNSGWINALELELTKLKKEGEQREEYWIRDFNDLLETNQRQLDLVDEVLVQMNGLQSQVREANEEKKKLEEKVNALELELTEAKREQEMSKKIVNDLQMRSYEKWR